MENRLKNTFVEFEFEDGEKVQLTLAFYLVYKLKAKNQKLYERYCKIMSKNKTEDLETITVLYTAYVCACIYNDVPDDDVITEEEFMIRCGCDRFAAADAAYKLLRKPKKQ